MRCLRTRWPSPHSRTHAPDAVRFCPYIRPNICDLDRQRRQPSISTPRSAAAQEPPRRFRNRAPTDKLRDAAAHDRPHKLECARRVEATRATEAELFAIPLEQFVEVT